ncbi:MAG TPA: DUF5752 family protein [Candidatus Nanoarchaeia archaeon]|nr:DUF5752 family protein [Candidatus Nanoarchaeia archaeon]
MEIPPEKRFFLCNGEVLSDVHELMERLKTMDDDVFKYHVNAERNDFANWIRDVFEDKKLAREIARIKIKENLAKKLFTSQYQ